MVFPCHITVSLPCTYKNDKAIYTPNHILNNKIILFEKKKIWNQSLIGENHVFLAYHNSVYGKRISDICALKDGNTYHQNKIMKEKFAACGDSAIWHYFNDAARTTRIPSILVVRGCSDKKDQENSNHLMWGLLPKSENCLDNQDYYYSCLPSIWQMFILKTYDAIISSPIFFFGLVKW